MSIIRLSSAKKLQDIHTSHTISKTCRFFLIATLQQQPAAAAMRDRPCQPSRQVSGLALYSQELGWYDVFPIRIVSLNPFQSASHAPGESVSISLKCFLCTSVKCFGNTPRPQVTHRASKCPRIDATTVKSRITPSPSRFIRAFSTSASAS